MLQLSHCLWYFSNIVKQYLYVIFSESRKRRGNMAIQKKRQQEKEVVAFMIALYCRKKHGGKELCPDCQSLTDYAQLRSDKCPFMESKTFCSNCHVHCYEPRMREKIRNVMRFSGPRMILHRPGMAIKHLIEQKKEANRMRK